MALVGRGEECRALDHLLASAREGLGGTLVIRGEAGIGKTALIDHAVAVADDFLVVRFAGVEAERNLGFAALHRLLRPILHQIERLPEPQRDALNSALGLAAGPPANPFLIGLGVMNLAANAVRARKRLLCVIDDAQWVDGESIETLAFWGRRLHADSTALIFGERDESETTSRLDGFCVLPVGRLADDAALALLTAEAGFGLDREVADRIVADTEGNPLAIVELGRDLTADQLIGAAAELQPLPLSRRLEQRFARQVRSLPADTQMLLLLAAADSSGDAAFLWRAASLLGVKPDRAEPAEALGLLALGSSVTFRHPLIRSAVYGGARPADRRAVHRALAAATSVPEDAERRAWHLAAASVGSDEEVAALLELCAHRAGERGGHSAEVALMSRAAELSPDPQRAAERRVSAAEAALARGAPLQAHALIALASPGLRDLAVGARAQRIDGCAWMREGKAAVAAPILLSAAIGLMPENPRLGRQTLLEAFEAAFLSGNLTDHEVTQAVAAAARAAPRGDSTTVDLLLDAFATMVTAGFVAAVPLLRSAVAAMSSACASAQQLIRWSALATFVTQAIWEQDAHDELMACLAQTSRQRGALPGSPSSYSRARPARCQRASSTQPRHSSPKQPTSSRLPARTPSPAS